MAHLSERMEEVINDAIEGSSRRVRDAANYLQKELKAVLNTKGSPDDPSKPGEPPHRVSGKLWRSIWKSVGKYGFRVGSSAPYSNYLEHGTKRMAPRPWFHETVEKSRDAIRRILYGSR